MITEKDFGLTPEEKAELVRGAQRFLALVEDEDDDETLLPRRVDRDDN